MDEPNTHLKLTMSSYQKAQVHHHHDDDSAFSLNNDGNDECSRKQKQHRPLIDIATLLLLLLGVAFVTRLTYSPYYNARGDKYLPIVGDSISEEDMNAPLFYNSQPVDHFNDNDGRTWSNRYYKSTKYFGGGGSPILMIVGGEGGLNHGMLYPFVTEVLAKSFKAAVIQIEHRFYGPYWPISDPTNDELLSLLTPHQAMADMVQLTGYFRDNGLTGCSSNKSSLSYCPVISIGGSYPGFLSAMFRFVYPNFVDIAYASAAPLLMYGQARRNTIYYDIVTTAADRLVPGCSKTIRATLEDAMKSADESHSLKEAANSVGVCVKGLPNEKITDKEDLKLAVVQMVAFAFASYNSDAYPPGPKTATYKACKTFQDPSLNNEETIRAFFQNKLDNEEREARGCDLMWVNCDDDDGLTTKKLPKCINFNDDGEDNDEPDEDGSNDGKMWNFQTCTNVIFLAGYGEDSLLPPTEATYDELTRDCQEEFGKDIVPRPWELVDKWNFVDGLEDQSYILFTNGMQDMWMGGSVTWNVSDTVLALNLDNGAHHSDLSHQGPTENDTEDITQGFAQIEAILKGWLKDIRGVE